jgi:phosphonoacetaldehyde hydrolase
MSHYLNIIRATRNHLNQHNFVIFGLPGIFVDYGRRVSISAYTEVFKKLGIQSITPKNIKNNMGIEVREHVKQLLLEPNILSEYLKIYECVPTEYLYDMLTQKINSKLMPDIFNYSYITSGSVELTQWLHRKNIKVGITSEYNKDITDYIVKELKFKGVHIDAYVAVDEVRISKPAPWQAKFLMQNLDVDHNTTTGIKIGDTVPDIIEAKKIGFTSCNTILSSGYMGFCNYQLKHVPREFINYRHLEIRRDFDAYQCNMYVKDIDELAKIWIDK